LSSNGSPPPEVHYGDGWFQPSEARRKRVDKRRVDFGFGIGKIVKTVEVFSNDPTDRR